MSCYHPLHLFRFPDGSTKVTSAKIHHIEYQKNKKPLYCDSKFISPYSSDVLYPIDIPCGQCIGCRLDYSREWANRCMMEAQYHEQNWFITLTYDDDHLPINAFGIPTLNDRHYKLFCKALRKGLVKGPNKFPPKKFRYYVAGEYGDISNRPHYHMLAFGLDLSDLVVYKRSNGFTLYNSPTLDYCWSEVSEDGKSRSQRGYVVVAPMSWETCAYTARYVMKKQFGKSSDVYSSLDILPEFSSCSTRPGIAFNYFVDHYDEIVKYDSITLSGIRGGITFRPPRYFYEQMKGFDLDQLSALKINHEYAGYLARENLNRKLQIDYYDYLTVQEHYKEKQIKALRRCLDETIPH